MEVELLEDLVNATSFLVVVVDVMEGTACGVHRQCGDIQTLAIWWYGGDVGCNTEAHIVELAQFLHQAINIPSVGSLGVKNRLSVVEDYENFIRGQGCSEGRQFLRVFDTSANNLRESVEKVGTRSRELVAANESPVIAKSFLDAIAVEDSKCDRRFPMPPGPMRAIGWRLSTRLTISLISPSRPKQALGGGGGNSPRGILRKHQVRTLAVLANTNLG
jgi:hypothetical protein